MNAPTNAREALVLEQGRRLELERVARKLKMQVGALTRYADNVETKLLAMCVAAANNAGVVGDDLIVEALELIASDATSQHARMAARDEIRRHATRRRR